MTLGEYIDQSLYPDLDEPPAALDTLEARADYVHRVCSAWDHGIHPDPATFSLLAEWHEVFDLHPILTSPAYHAFRAWFDWPPRAFPANMTPPTPFYVHLDRLEERDDPCERMI